MQVNPHGYMSVSAFVSKRKERMLIDAQLAELGNLQFMFCILFTTTDMYIYLHVYILRRDH